jgi:predicted ABC-type ATPase
MRMFAGPNGSGKSTLKSYLRPALLGVFLNPDEIEEEIRKTGFLDFSKYAVQTTREEVIGFFTESSFLKSAGLLEESQKLRYADGHLEFSNIPVNSYFASVASDFLRQKLLQQKLSFTVETVMSHPSKVNLLAQSQRLGYRTYLYFVATDDPAINISRVRNRVALGGHAVPEHKIGPPTIVPLIY